jgi:hypothetical protein
MKNLRWVRKKVVFNFLNGAVGTDLIQSESMAYEGELLWIHQINGSNIGTKTAQLTLEDRDSIEYFDGTAKAHNASYDFEFGVTIRRILSGDDTLKCTISGDPGVGGYEVTAVLYFLSNRPYLD